MKFFPFRLYCHVRGLNVESKVFIVSEFYDTSTLVGHLHIGTAKETSLRVYVFMNKS